MIKRQTNPVLESLGRRNILGIGISPSRGGSGGDLRDLFDCVAETARTSPATARILAVQRHFAEVLIASENIAVAEYRLRDILDGTISGACTATWPSQALSPLHARVSRGSMQLNGALHRVPNVGEAWYLVTALLQPHPERARQLAILSSEQDGMHRESDALDSTNGDDTAMITARNVFFRPDEIVQEDTAATHDHLTRLATLLKCAIEAGQAWRAVEHMDGELGADARATLARTVNCAMRPAKHVRDLPTLDVLRTAARSLRLLHRVALTGS